MAVASKGNRLTRWDLAGMLAGCLYALAITGVLSRGRIFWEDEMLGWMLLRDPSWRHMLLAYNAGADGGGFTFYLTGRAWLHLFGPSELAFRLYSATCFGLAFAVTWAAMRRFYSIGIVAFAISNTWFFSPPFVEHMTEGRFYGLLVLGVSLAVWLAFRLADLQTPTPARFYAITFFVHALLTTSHLLGVAFSASLLAATVLLDLLAQRTRPLLYLAGAASWLLLVPERANLRASAAVGKPHFWTKPPRLADVIAVYTGSCKEIALVLAILLLLAGFALLRSRNATASLRAGYAARRPVYVITGVLLLVPAAFYAEGLIGIWLFNDRYLLPITVAVAYGTAELLQIVRSQRILSPLRLPPLLRLASPWAAGLVFLAAMLFWDLKHLRNFSESPRDYTAQLTALLPRGMPVVCEDAFSFTDLIGRQHASGVPYVYLLDWQGSLSPSAPRLEVTQFHLMENWRTVGYFSGSIEPIDEFLQRNEAFLVVHAEPYPPNALPPEIGNPLAERFAHDPAYEVRPVAELQRYKKRDVVYLVCRGHCGMLPAPQH